MHDGGDAAALAALGATDARLADLLDRVGRPPPFRRAATLRSLALVVLEQQLSLDAAAAHLAALEEALAGPPTPALLAGLDADTARAAGVSRQKHRTLVELGRAALDGRLDIDGLADLDDAAARAALLDLHGIGPWTADVVLLAMLGRADVWPVGDRALQVAAHEELGLVGVPGPAELERVAAPWRPHRSAAARLLWHAYLLRRGRTAPVVA